jgi:hypothetical protein
VSTTEASGGQCKRASVSVRVIYVHEAVTALKQDAFPHLSANWARGEVLPRCCRQRHATLRRRQMDIKLCEQNSVIKPVSKPKKIHMKIPKRLSAVSRTVLHTQIPSALLSYRMHFPMHMSSMEVATFPAQPYKTIPSSPACTQRHPPRSPAGGRCSS